MTEADLLQEVIARVQRYGLLSFHDHDSRRNPAGFPDLVIVGRRLLFRELKSAAGQLSVRQNDWRFGLVRAGADWSVWRPSDLASGRIERELARIAG